MATPFTTPFTVGKEFCLCSLLAFLSSLRLSFLSFLASFFESESVFTLLFDALLFAALLFGWGVGGAVE